MKENSFFTLKTLKEYGLPILAAILVALLVRSFLIETYHISNPTMRPTLEPGDLVFVSKLHPEKLLRGDVVVFSIPSDPDHDSVKRIIGLQGDRIEIKNGRVIHNGKILDQFDKRNPIKSEANCSPERSADGKTYSICKESPAPDDFGPETVPNDSVFVLGDLRTAQNKDISQPKTWGFIPKTMIKGKVLGIWLSIEPFQGRSQTFLPLRLDRMFKRI